VLIEPFSLGVLAEALQANIGSKLVISLQLSVFLSIIPKLYLNVVLGAYGQQTMFILGSLKSAYGLPISVN